MTRAIHITRAAKRDLDSAADYIEHVLLNPQAADGLIDEAESILSALTSFPEKYSLADDPVLKAWGVRFVPVKNYLAFYVVSEQDQAVYVIRFLYSKRNWVSVLKNGFINTQKGDNPI